MNVVTLGDALLDVIVRREHPHVNGRDTAETHLSVGGQAAYVAAWVAALGGHATFVGARGDDVVARMGATQLYSLGVSLRGPVVSGDREPVALVDGWRGRHGDGDGAVDHRLTATDLEPGWFTGADRVHISGHGLLTAAMSDAMVVAARFARAAGARVSVDLVAAPMIRFVGAEHVAERLSEIRPDVVLGTDEEFDALPVAPRARVRVVKQGAAGVTAHVRGARPRHDPAPDVSVVDTTGAGDAFAAGFLLGRTMDDALAGGRRAAGICISRVGAMPPRDLRPMEVGIP